MTITILLRSISGVLFFFQITDDSSRMRLPSSNSSSTESRRRRRQKTKSSKTFTKNSLKTIQLNYAVCVCFCVQPSTIIRISGRVF